MSNAERRLATRSKMSSSLAKRRARAFEKLACNIRSGNSSPSYRVLLSFSADTWDGGGSPNTRATSPRPENASEQMWR